MDRDKRWERVQRSYLALTGLAESETDPIKYIETQYEAGVTDEFIEPINLGSAAINQDSSLICFNFRADRMREIVTVLTQDFSEFETPVKLKKNDTLCFTSYESTFGLPALFAEIEIKNHLGNVIADAGLKQIRIAETEKYPHVTYFLNGLNETPVDHEERNVLPSPKDVATYDLKPEMSAEGVKDAVIDALNSDVDLIIVNFANCDMVGHTGNLDAAIKAVEVVDKYLGEILKTLKSVDAQALIIADHGNAEQMIKADGSPHTAHTTFLVPAILVNCENKIFQDSKKASLANVAPTILDLMSLDQPSEMTSKSIITSK